MGIAQAYSILADAEKRKEYDQFGCVGSQSNSTGPGNEGFAGYSPGHSVSSEEAEALFRQFFGAGGFGPSMPGGAQFVFSSTGSSGDGGSGATSFFSTTSCMEGDDEVKNFGSGAGVGNPFGAMFQNFGGFGGRARRKRHRSSSGMERLAKRRSTACTIPQGSAVAVHGLAKALDHNGRIGHIRDFDCTKRRYVVSFDKDQTISLKPQNLTQTCSVEITGVGQKPELNGRRGVVQAFDLQTGRYVVTLESAAAPLSLQPANCLLEVGSCVVLHKLSRADMNGMMGKIISVDKIARRYTLQCENEQQIKVKYENVLC